LSSYASADNNGADGDQGNAVYRTIMFQNYIPVMEAGGLFGWVQFPVIDGQTSIDNAYLYFGLTQGYLGAVSFTLMIIDSFISVFLYLRRFTQKQDIAFVFCLGGSILGIAFCIGTVFLTSPVSELIFLMVGWTQSLRTSEPISETLAPAVRARHSFRRVFT